MSLRIRRHSMECLKLYDIDPMKSMSSPLSSSPPAIPPVRTIRQHLPEHFAFERYGFLCDMDRHRTDPVYAATPMFTTIIPNMQIKYSRRLLGLRIPQEIIKPCTPSTSSSSSSSDSESTDSDKDDESNDDQNSSEENDNHDDEAEDQSSSSSSSPDDDIDDDNDNKGIVEQIFNRDKN